MLIDTFTPDWQDRFIREQMENADGRQLFLLIDGAFLPDFYRAVQRVLPDGVRVALLFERLPVCSDRTRSVSPFLVPCSAMSATLGYVLKKCSGWPMVSAIETPETIDALAKRLSAWCIVENDGQRFNFRFPDTRRLPGMFDALSPVQRGSLAGPAHRWSYIGRDGAWHQLAMPETASAVADGPTLDDHQFVAMVTDSEIDETIVLLRDRGPLPQMPHAETYSIVQEARRVAALAGLDENLYLDWCRHCLEKVVRLNDTNGVAAAQAWHALSNPDYHSTKEGG